MATDSILLLPVDILVNIFKLLNLSDLRNLMLSCKSFNDLIKNDNTIWRPIGRDKLLIDMYDRSVSNSLWYNRCRTSYNWCHGYYNSKVVVNHYTNYMPWLIYNYTSRSILLSVGSELHCYTTNRRGYPICREPLWKVDVPKIQRHDIRTNDISRFVLTNNYIACGNRDGCLIMYQRDSKDRPWLQYHVQDCHDNGRKEVTAVEAIEGRSKIMAVTGSAQSSELKFFAFFKEENTNSMYVVRGNESNTHNVTMYENTGTKCLALSPTIDKLAIGLDGNSRPLVLDVNIPAFLMTADLTINPKQVLRDIRWHDANTIVYATHAGVLQMIDIRTKEVVYDTKDPFQSSFYCVKSDGNYGIVTGTAEYSRCVLFDTRNQVHHVQMYFTQRKASPVYSLDFDPYRLITAVDRGVAVLDFNVVAASEEQKDFSHIFY